MTRTRTTVGMLLALLAFAPGAAEGVRADEITDTIDTALSYYAEGDIKAAITELEFAIEAMRARIGDLYLETLAPAPAGWTAEPATREAGAALLGGGSTITRTYLETGGDGRIEARLMVDNPMMQMVAGMLSNPALMAAQPTMKRVRIGRENALLDWRMPERSGDLTFVSGRAMIQLSASGLDDPQIVVDLLRAFDLETISDLAAG